MEMWIKKLWGIAINGIDDMTIDHLKFHTVYNADKYFSNASDRCAYMKIIVLIK